jgi:hypothetical protein
MTNKKTKEMLYSLKGEFKSGINTLQEKENKSD